MLYLIQSDTSVVDNDEMKDCILQTEEIQQIYLKYMPKRKAYCIVISFKTERTGWLALYETEPKCRAVLADLLDHMRSDNMMAQMIRTEVME